MDCSATDLGAFCSLAGTALWVVYKRVVARDKQTDYVWISNPVEFNSKLKKMKAGGAKKLQVIADFDRTLTSCFYAPGERGMSAHGLIETSPHLTPEYHKEARANFHKYHPLEITPSLTIEQKIPLMKEWYEKGHALLVKQNFKRDYITEAVRSGKVRLRDGARDLIHYLGDQKVPLLVMSAGLGDVLEEVLSQKAGPLPDSTYVISNRMKFDDEGVLYDFSEPLIHMFNKHETHDPDAEYYGDVAGRTNVILLGDGIGDTHMADGLETDTILTIGFLNERMDELWEQYVARFDVVILNDGNMSFVQSTIAKLLE